MFEKLFAKFKKQLSKPEKTAAELEAEFDKLKVAYCNIANSDLYQLLKEYFEAKIEINRDIIELKNVNVEAERVHIAQAQAEIKVMRDFIVDIEGMKAEQELEALAKSKEIV
jgi:hypothetical protein